MSDHHRFAVTFGFASGSAQLLPDLPGTADRGFKPFATEEALLTDPSLRWLRDMDQQRASGDAHVDGGGDTLLHLHPHLPLVWGHGHPVTASFSGPGAGTDRDMGSDVDTAIEPSRKTLWM